jgi:hypothetical protein
VTAQLRARFGGRGGGRGLGSRESAAGVRGCCRCCRCTPTHTNARTHARTRTHRRGAATPIDRSLSLGCTCQARCRCGTRVKSGNESEARGTRVRHAVQESEACRARCRCGTRVKSGNESETHGTRVRHAVQESEACRARCRCGSRVKSGNESEARGTRVRHAETCRALVLHAPPAAWARHGCGYFRLLSVTFGYFRLPAAGGGRRPRGRAEVFVLARRRPHRRHERHLAARVGVIRDVGRLLWGCESVGGLCKVWTCGSVEVSYVASAASCAWVLHGVSWVLHGKSDDPHDPAGYTPGVYVCVRARVCRVSVLHGAAWHGVPSAACPPPTVPTRSLKRLYLERWIAYFTPVSWMYHSMLFGLLFFVRCGS